MGDAAALFAADDIASSTAHGPKKVFKKRIMLWEQDHVAMHMLNVFGKSNFDQQSEEGIWKMKFTSLDIPDDSAATRVVCLDQTPFSFFEFS